MELLSLQKLAPDQQKDLPGHACLMRLECALHGMC